MNNRPALKTKKQKQNSSHNIQQEPLPKNCTQDSIENYKNMLPIEVFQKERNRLNTKYFISNPFTVVRVRSTNLQNNISK